ncbi:MULTISPECIES: DMT family transporter [unclassified Sporosarcina]|uniref:DMT family transporter n=1 Tax=unclassified Sporosarcina TaxID=2647733 RepID=UPI000C16C1D9|nr:MULTISPECIES: EamA family transporter [unclassified Sporosarcina]PIC98925.1 EamA family transporter [Sporosarcina sp. P29]PID04819.1 EamA family transporter [Sporosarcina sp. P30]PID07974.1 EamA family transporter [Sporosarcina sp. P31]PID11160.1 EamA family transporter [Sporosarcina sp. P32b]
MLRLKGIIMIIIGSMLWGATGPMMEWILNHSDMSVSMMLILRLTIAGAVVLLLLKAKGIQVGRPMRQKLWLRKMVMFGVIGMLGVQFGFVQTIAHSDAVVATLFQFVAPVYIIILLSLLQRSFPPGSQVIGMVVALFGLILLLTNGSFSSMSLDTTAIVWGVIVGFAFTFYTLYPVVLMAEWGVLLVVGWGMFIGGMTLFIINLPMFFMNLGALLNGPAMGMLLLVIIMGTLAFIMFLQSMTYISPVETSVLSSFEPLTAMIVSVFWLGQTMGVWQISGAAIMLVGVVWLSIGGNRKKKTAPFPETIQEYDHSEV